MRQTNADNSAAVGVMAFIVIAIVILYFIFKMLLVVGIGIALISFVLMLFGFGYEEEQLIVIGIIGLLIGIVLALIGYTGVNFFENNPTGKNILEGANTAINITKENANIYAEATSDINKGVRNIKSIPLQHNIPHS